MVNWSGNNLGVGSCFNNNLFYNGMLLTKAVNCYSCEDCISFIFHSLNIIVSFS